METLRLRTALGLIGVATAGARAIDAAVAARAPA